MLQFISEGPVYEAELLSLTTASNEKEIDPVGKLLFR